MNDTVFAADTRSLARRSVLHVFRRLSIAHQFLIVLLILSVGTFSAFAFWVSDTALQAELAHARTVADMADAFRAQVARRGGIYVRREASEDIRAVGRFLGQFASTHVAADGSRLEYRFHHKNPFLALGEYSAEVQRSAAAAKFKMVSDNYMNPANQPDLFDILALQTMREQGVKEYWDVKGSSFRYARSLRAERSCLSCHGDPAGAPETVRAQYRPPVGSQVGGGYGYQEGAIVGITSVVVPHRSALASLRSQGIGFWASAAAVLLMLIGMYAAVWYGVVRPLRTQARYAEEIAEADDPGGLTMPQFDDDERSSTNEIHKQSFALKSLHTSMHTATRYIDSSSRRR